MLPQRYQPRGQCRGRGSGEDYDGEASQRTLDQHQHFLRICKATRSSSKQHVFVIIVPTAFISYDRSCSGILTYNVRGLFDKNKSPSDCNMVRDREAGVDI